MFAWSRTFYAVKDGVCYNFEMKKQRDDACLNHGMTKVSAYEARKYYWPYIRVEWRDYKKVVEGMA